MADVARFDGGVRIAGDLVVDGNMPKMPRSRMTQDANAAFGIPLTDMRIWDVMATILPASSGNDDLGLVTGTLGTHAPKLTTGDVKTTTVTRYAAFLFSVPVEYEAAETITCRISAGMETTAADTSATVDVQAYKSDRDGTSGADICGTAAQSINSTDFADKDFVISPTGISAGDLLIVRVAIAVVDGSTVTAVTATIGAVEILCDIKG